MGGGQERGKGNCADRSHFGNCHQSHRDNRPGKSRRQKREENATVDLLRSSSPSLHRSRQFYVSWFRWVAWVLPSPYPAASESLCLRSWSHERFRPLLLTFSSFFRPPSACFEAKGILATTAAEQALPDFLHGLTLTALCLFLIPMRLFRRCPFAKLWHRLPGAPIQRTGYTVSSFCRRRRWR